MLIHQQDELSDFVKSEIDAILKRLLNHEPIQYITGEAPFYGMELTVKPGVLIPRPETAELVDLIIDRNKNISDLKVLDVCTGSGCIAIALARNLPFSKVTAIDISPEAYLVAKENSEKLKTKIKLINADIFEWTPEERYDIIVSNPPYVMDKEALAMDRNVLDYEPHEALFVRDENPLVFYRRIAELAGVCLNKDGRLYFEINPECGKELVKLMDKSGFEDVTLLRDSYGRDRFLTCKKGEGIW